MPPSPPRAVGPELVDATPLSSAVVVAAVLKLFTENRDAVIRRTQQISQKDSLRTKRGAVPPTFNLGNPSHGSYHVVVPVEAEGFARYLFRVPLDGIKGKWDSASERSLKTEAETMKSLHSTIPVPYVYDYCATIDNPIGCPFIVISEIVGLPLYDVWFGHQLHPDKITRKQTKAHRARALDGIAKAMVKLGKFTAARAGAPEFNEKGELVDVGATRVVDHMAMIDASQGGDGEVSSTSSTDVGESANVTTEERGLTSTLTGGASWVLHGIASMAPAVLFGSVPQSDTLPDTPVAESDTCEDTAEVAIYADCLPTTTPEKYYTRPLDLRAQEHRYSMAVESFLRLLISCIPEPKICGDGHTEHRFVLAHPDFNIQNFIVESDGSLMGIIDWDGVETVPRSVGNLALPGWLTRDWDPIRYAHDPAMDDEAAIAGGYQPESLWEDSVCSLAKYRDMYADLIAQYTTEGSADSGECAKIAANTCHQSLLADNLAIASCDPVCRDNILEKVVSEMWTALIDRDSGLCLSDDDSNVDVDMYPTFYGIAQMYFEGEVDDAFENHIRKGFEALLASLARH